MASLIDTLIETLENEKPARSVDMTEDECTLLAGIPNAPSVYSLDANPDLAKKYNLEIKRVINQKDGQTSTLPYTEYGVVCNSGEFDGLTSQEAKIKIVEKLEKLGCGRFKTNYRLRDWSVARQRYWGEPVPTVQLDDGTIYALKDEELPLVLPELEDYKGRNGKAPLDNASEWKNYNKNGVKGVRETSTMPGSAGSSWYFLRYVDPNNDKEFASMDKLNYWMPVDWYNGGMEHVTRHLLYSRFWHQFLYDEKLVNTPEPYAKRTAQGLILGSDGEKMSKSRGNVVDPLDIVNQYGADTLRVYVMFMGDYGMAAPWNDASVKGCKRFLDRVATLTDIVTDAPVDEIENAIHKAIKKVTSDIEEQKFNTAIACLMALLNDITKAGKIGKEQLVSFLKLLSPFAPHIAEEAYHQIGFNDFLTVSAWPTYDEAKTIDSVVNIGVQVNGKVRGTVGIPKDASKEDALAIGKANEKVASFLEGKTIVKEIYVPGKILNFVVK